jgi:hypothetical protein
MSYMLVITKLHYYDYDYFSWPTTEQGSVPHRLIGHGLMSRAYT